MSISTEELLQLKRELSAKYNTDFDKELMPLMAELRETRLVVDEGLRSALSTLEQAAARVNASQKTVQFTSSSQAFWHGFGKWGVMGTMTVILAFVCFLLNFNRGEANVKAEQIKAFIQANESLQAFSTLSINSKLEKVKFDKSEVHYIKLYPSADFYKAEIGKNVVVDPKCKCVKIPLMYTKK